MKQILQNLSNGETYIEEVPCPNVKKGHILIKSHKSLISTGTEKMLVDFGKSGLINKARSQPDKVKEALEKIQADGIVATMDAIKSKLDQPLPLGYCNVGTIIDPSDSDLCSGTRVVSNGNHAEIICVPKNLVAKIPCKVDDETAAFTVVGSIAMQGIRLIDPKIGENVVVTGLGLIGLLAIQILKANGCRVLGIDYDKSKCDLAKSFGVEVVNLGDGQDPIVAVNSFTRGHGADSVLITASSKSNDVVHQAAKMSRKRGKIVLVGVVGLELNRTDFYEKELSFQVSCSYGPGRHDKNYEVEGIDYPYAFVRWTEQRNFEAVLDLMSDGLINVKPLITHRASIDEFQNAYEQLNNPSSLGILFDYQHELTDNFLQNTLSLEPNRKSSVGQGNVSFIGGGNYASRILMPSFVKAGASLRTIVTSGGLSAIHHGKKNGFLHASTNIEEALSKQVDAVVIATQHNLHAAQTIKALEKNKHVFVEKPLALTHLEIDEIEAAQADAKTMVMVGYNRRFSPHIRKIKTLINAKPSPKTFIMTMNAGEIPKEHWTQNNEIGGGRIIGEACHYIDLMRFLAGSKIKSFNAVKMGENDFVDVTEDKAVISLVFEDGSIGSIHYFANGGKSFPKERIEVFCDNAVLQLNNFRKLRGYGWKGFKKMNLWSQDKGQENCVDAFMQSVVKGGQNPIPQDEIFEVARASVDIAKMLKI